MEASPNSVASAISASVSQMPRAPARVISSRIVASCVSSSSGRTSLVGASKARFCSVSTSASPAHASAGGVHSFRLPVLRVRLLLPPASQREAHRCGRFLDLRISPCCVWARHEFQFLRFHLPSQISWLARKLPLCFPRHHAPNSSTECVRDTATHRIFVARLIIFSARPYRVCKARRHLRFRFPGIPSFFRS